MPLTGTREHPRLARFAAFVMLTPMAVCVSGSGNNLSKIGFPGREQARTAPADNLGEVFGGRAAVVFADAAGPWEVREASGRQRAEVQEVGGVVG